MAAPVVVFVPGYPEPGNAQHLAHRFGHALAMGGESPVALELDEVDAVPLAPFVDAARFPGAGPAPEPSSDEKGIFAKVHESILESNARMLQAPAAELLRDPHLAGHSDPLVGMLQTYFQFLFEYAAKQEVRYGAQEAVRAALAKHARRDIIVCAHGLGAMVAYDTVFKLGPSAPPLRFVTIGASIGLGIVQRRLKAKARADGFLPVPERVLSWVNVTHPLDAVAGDPTLGDEFRWTDVTARVEDRPAHVDTGWPFHRWEGYARSSAVRKAIADVLGR